MRVLAGCDPPGPLVEAGQVSGPAEDADIEAVVASQPDVGHPVLVEEAARPLEAVPEILVLVGQVARPRAVAGHALEAVTRARVDTVVHEADEVSLKGRVRCDLFLEAVD